MKILSEHEFSFVETIRPILSSDGSVKEFYPQASYKKHGISALHEYGDGAFCRFSIDPKWSGMAGVYALYIEDTLVYIGQCVDLAQRFNLGYGNISPRNCFVGGQSTNCKINKVVLEAAKAGKTTAIYFYRTLNYNAVESALIEHYKPEYNALSNTANATVCSGEKISYAEKVTHRIGVSISTDDIRQYIRCYLERQKALGYQQAVLISGDIHRDMALKDRFPMVCNAMYSMMRNGDKILETTPSGKSSTIKIQYQL